MKDSTGISMSVIRRLPRYYQYLTDLSNNGIERISSSELAEKMGLTASQIRQDFNCFGGFGLQGYGYNTKQLANALAGIMGLDSDFSAILIGAGNLGRAVAAYLFSEQNGFKLIAVFDSDKKLEGKKVGKFSVMHMDALEDFCRENKPVTAVLCVPDEAAKEVALKLDSLGVKSFWNFSHFDISLILPNSRVENVHLKDSLMTLCFLIKSDMEKNKEKH